MTQPIDDGGPAFPVKFIDGGDGEAVTEPGMTLRDWFAGLAMQSMFMNGGTDSAAWRTMAAKHSYGMADQMIAQRKTENAK